MLLRFAPERFTSPTDRDMLPSERREFVRTHRTCVFGYNRRHDGPALSIVYYVATDDGDLLVSTMAARAKALAVARDPKVSLCVLDERWPLAYLQVYADATVDTDVDLALDVMMAVGERMSGAPLADNMRPLLRATVAAEQRVVLRCRPYTTFAQPPRQVSQDQRAARPPLRSSGDLARPRPMTREGRRRWRLTSTRRDAAHMPRSTVHHKRRSKAVNHGPSRAPRNDA